MSTHGWEDDDNYVGPNILRWDPERIKIMHEREELHRREEEERRKEEAKPPLLKISDRLQILEKHKKTIGTLGYYQR